MEFPGRLVLTDTGERRFPEEGEVYCVRDGLGRVSGPFINDESSEVYGEDCGWMLESDAFAIYKVSVEG